MCIRDRDGSKETGRWVQSNRLFITPDTLDEDAMPPEDVEVQGEWRENDNGRWYRYPDGSYPKNTWVSIFGEKYFFDEKGYMVTGWVEWKDKEYYRTVSYTHLDVYKRQRSSFTASSPARPCSRNRA